MSFKVAGDGEGLVPSRHIKRGMCAAPLLACAVGMVLVASASCAPRAADVPYVNIITGGTGGGWYSIGAAIAERTNMAFEGHPLTAIPGAGGISNPARIARAPGDLGMSFLPFLRAAIRGDPPYGQQYNDLRYIATLTENKLHLLVGRRSDLSSLDDIKSRRLAVNIATGFPGSGEEFLLRECLAYYGISYEDIRAWGGRVDLLGTSERADAWRDGRADLIAFSLNEPAPLITELLTTRPARLWSAPAAVQAALLEKWQIRPLSIDAGVYPQHDQVLPTVGLAAVLFARHDLNELIVYELTKAIAESKDYLESVHPGFKTWEPVQMLERTDVPLHSGAERYYRERGWLQP